MRPFASQPSLFADPAPPLPGLRYEADFLSADEEAQLIEHISALPLEEMRYKSYTARRRIVSFGGRYDFDRNRLQRSPDAPAWLEPLRARAARWLGVPPDAFTQILVAEYRPGTPLGWHRDVPDFEDVVGVSLASDAIMRFRRYGRPPRFASGSLPPEGAFLPWDGPTAKRPPCFASASLPPEGAFLPWDGPTAKRPPCFASASPPHEGAYLPPGNPTAKKPPREPILKLAVQARSIYLLSGAARWEWQHSVAPTPALRYSITFRTAARPHGGPSA